MPRYFAMDAGEDAGEAPAAERPAPLLEVRPQERVGRHTGVGYEIAQNLEVPVPQMGEQLPDVLQFFATFLPFVAEQVIEVPKIFLDRTPQRLGDRLCQPQTAEQLMEVPTVVSYLSLIVDIPVPGRDGGGARGSLQGFPPGQGSAAPHVEQTVDIPVPGRAGGGGRAGLQGFAGQSSTASSSHVGAADGAGQAVFRTFPQIKKSAKHGPHSGSELGADFTPSTLSAHQMPPEQLVDVPVPQVRERSSGNLAYELETCKLERLHRRREAEEAARLAVLEEEQMEEEEEEEEVAVSRFLPHFRPRLWCWYVRAGSICPRGWDCTFAHHESELHPDSWWCIVLVGGWPGFRGLACLGPFLGAPAGSPEQVKYTGGTVSGAWHPLTPSWVLVRGASAPQIMEDVVVVQLVPTAGEQIVVCQCHRSCWYVEVASVWRASTGAVPGQGC